MANEYSKHIVYMFCEAIQRLLYRSCLPIMTSIIHTHVQNYIHDYWITFLKFLMANIPA